MTGPRRRPKPAATPVSIAGLAPATPGTLFVVATPIGNLEDVTLRALRVLREAASVAAEDTRRTAKLLRHYQIATPLWSLHEHNERGRIERVISDLRIGRSIALVSDAGTPGIADPGSLIVRAVRDAGLKVEPIPGPRAVSPADSVAGLDAPSYDFLGFPPPTGRARQKYLSRINELRDFSVVLFEAPHRMKSLLRELLNILGEQQIIIFRELTKIYESAFVGTTSEAAGRLTEFRGEFVLILPPRNDEDRGAEAKSDADVARVFGQITDSWFSSRREAIRITADRLGLSPKAVFDALERAKKP
jgi:16S rRNA (cytidine1402-2'-O)-methyltransferase